jgi:hypothetical protein
VTDEEDHDLRTAIEQYSTRHGLDAAALLAVLERPDDQPDALPEPPDLRPEVLHHYPH